MTRTQQIQQLEQDWQEARWQELPALTAHKMLSRCAVQFCQPVRWPSGVPVNSGHYLMAARAKVTSIASAL